MQKLNFGCGSRFSSNWTNIDFHSPNDQVMRVNPLEGFPFPENQFDAVYSSHVLEHFTRDQAKFLLDEAYRVLKPGGIVRIVVPDLEATCREYLAVLELDDAAPLKHQKYEWILIELLDQLVRTTPGGAMGAYLRSAAAGKNSELLRYLHERVGKDDFPGNAHKDAGGQRPTLTWAKITNKLLYTYIKVLTLLFPPSMRDLIVNQTSIGERHRWMYDFYGLGMLMQESSFAQVKRQSFEVSDIPGFDSDILDRNADGTAYKKCSLHLAARQP
jgi:predicted SAM-dependent methyltransferase